MINFSNEKCTSCGLCKLVCPAGIIIQEGDNVPFVKEESLNTCRKCGHCEAFCPTGAVSSSYEGEYSALWGKSISRVRPQQLKDHLYARRTIRLFQEKLVEPEKLEEIMDTVRYSPSGSNRQPVKWIILNGPEKVQNIGAKVASWMGHAAERDRGNPYTPFFRTAARAFKEGKDLITRKAPQMILSIVPSGNILAQTDSTIALSWFEILSQSYGIGTCWLGLVKMAVTNDPSILEDLKIPEGYELGYSMAFGYAKYPARTIPKRNKADITWI